MKALLTAWPFWALLSATFAALTAIFAKVGVENIMFEGDYPHSDSNFPHSRKKLEGVLSDVPDDQARLIAEDNARRLFNFPRS